MELKGRIAVVTGAGSGIGRGLALALADEGVAVSLADLDSARLDAVAEEVRSRGVRALATVTDVADSDAVERLADATVAELGGVHVVCNNAGVSTLGRQWETSREDWEWVLGVCLWGVINGVRTFVPRLLAAGEGGHIVNTSSMGGLLTAPLIGPYTAAKHAVVGLSKGLRAELAGDGIGVTVVCPGEVRTGIVDAMREHLGGGRADGAPPATDVMLDALGSGLATVGIDPDEAGAMIVAAIRDNQFWVLPNGARHLPSVQADMDELFASAP